MADTHTALWYVFNDSRLSKSARHFIESAANSGRKIAVSAISLVEVIYLVEKRRLEPSAYVDLKNALNDPSHVLQEEPVTSTVVESMRLISRESVPDMPDRIIAATAVHLGVPLISRDGLIRASSAETIW